MKRIDLTHSFIPEMPAYPGDPKATLTQAANIDTDGYTDHQLHTLMHVGTHMDAPLHMIKDGAYMDEISLDTFFGTGILIDARGKQIIDASILAGLTIEPNAIVLVYTGFGDLYRTPQYFENYPQIDESFAKRMVELKVKIVGMDIVGPDQPPFPTHKQLLGHGILIIENLANLDALLDVKNFEVLALPAKLHTDATPVRVIATIL
jgi:kynurenine formamidase